MGDLGQFGYMAPPERAAGCLRSATISEIKIECHHCPANSVSPLSKGDGPAIQMEKGDHRQTASWGNSKEAQQYRAKQSEMIENGDFSGAQQMDIDDVQSKFGNKYDDAIEQMRDYTDELDR